MRGSDGRTFACLLVLACWVMGSGCARTIIAVDRPPCPDAAPDPTGACPPSDLVEGLVGYWRLDDAAGTSRAHDGSGLGNEGLLIGLDPATAWTTGGPEGGSLDIAGKGHLEVSSSTSIDSITNELTVAAWMFIDGTIEEFATAISRQVGTSIGQHYHLAINAQMNPTLFITTTSLMTYVFVKSPSSVPSQTWIHLVGTYDGAEARLYVDGAQVASMPQTGAFMAESNPVILSGNANESAHTVVELIPGRLAGVMLYHRALSPDQIRRLYAQPPGSP